MTLKKILKSFLVSSAFLLLYSSTYCETNVEVAQDRSEDTPSISRTQSLHHLLEENDHDEEEYSVVLALGKRLAKNLLAQHQYTFNS